MRFFDRTKSGKKCFFRTYESRCVLRTLGKNCGNSLAERLKIFGHKRVQDLKRICPCRPAYQVSQKESVDLSHTCMTSCHAYVTNSSPVSMFDRRYMSRTAYYCIMGDGQTCSHCGAHRVEELFFVFKPGPIVDKYAVIRELCSSCVCVRENRGGESSEDER